MPDITEQIKENFGRIAICAEPVYSLVDCVIADDKRREAINEDIEIEENENPITDISERFHTYLYLCNEAELGFLRYAAELSEKKAPWEDNLDYYPSNVFLYNDLMYLFLWEDKYYLVFPDELAEKYRNAMMSKGFTTANAYKLELSMYAAALLNLYGAYEMEWFVTVWNHHHKNKINIDEAREFLSDRAYFNSDFYFIDGYVVHDCLFYEDFDELWEETEDMDYYMPTKSVIREYANIGHDLDIKIPGQTEMDAFLAEFIKDETKLDDLQDSIAFLCERISDPAKVLRELENADAPISDEDFRGKFERLYNNLRDNSHIWELRGFTPPQYQDETGEAIPRFKLPKVKGGKGRKRK